MAQSQVAGLGSNLGTKKSSTGRTSVNVTFTLNAEGQNNGLLIGLKALNKRAPRNLRNLLDEWANYMTVWMMKNHKWKNRSGAAERGIHAQVSGRSNQYGGQTTIELRHGDTVWYGWRLENLYDRKYAIIEPTINKFANDIMATIDIQKLYWFV